jgi:hypothetical protein
MEVHSRLGDTTYRRQSRQGGYSLVCGQRQRPRHRHNFRFRRTSIECADSTVPPNPSLRVDGRAASTDTTSTALSYTVYFLLKDPRTFAKLRDEVRGEFKNVDEITQARTMPLPYLNAVIQEGISCIQCLFDRSLEDETACAVRSATRISKRWRHDNGEIRP